MFATPIEGNKTMTWQLWIRYVPTKFENPPRTIPHDEERGCLTINLPVDISFVSLAAVLMDGSKLVKPN